VHRFKVGNFDCIVLNDGCSAVENLSERLPNAAPEKLQAAMDTRGIKEIVSCYNCLYIDTEQHKVLADTGLGKTGHGGHLFDGFADNNIAPEDIDTLVITHFHGDHINGILDSDGNVNFPNARYVAWKTEWDYWTSDAKMMEMDEQWRNRMEPRYEVMRQNLTLMTGENEIVPGISAVALPGHTPGHMGLLVESEDVRLVHVVDAIHYLPQLANVGWAFKFDSDPVQASETRKNILNRAAAENLLTLMYHFPFPGLGYVGVEGDEFTWKPIT
ncbi:MAG: MBL fold metallo-hydrolase, partial [Chloroflexi bacterium]|nr:MBL fold metallo-hydrolase [Chloroflexota bacterium]